MIKEISIQNIQTNNVVNMGYEGSFIIDEINWDAPSISLDSYRVPFQIGTTFLGVTIGDRTPTITGHIVADLKNENVLGMKWNDYFKRQEQLIEEQKEVLNRLININQLVIIKAGEYSLKAKPTQPPKYSSNESENNEVLCYFDLEFECFDPLFYSETKYVELATIQESFHFPLVIPKEKVIFGEIQKRQSISVQNDSDVDCGCIKTIKATGGIVTNPRVYNVNTGEYIAFEGVSLNQNDVLTINTNIGEENVIVHRAETAKNERIIGKLVRGSKFIQIKQGVNFYAYEVESGSASVEVVIEYTQKRINIKGM